jgi:hypothetical protein
MHLLVAAPGSVVDETAAVDLGQTPGEIVVLTAADSEIALLADAHEGLRREFGAARVPRLRLANWLRLRHNLSVDLHVDAVGRAGEGRRRARARRAELLALRRRSHRRHGARVGRAPRAAAGRRARGRRARRSLDGGRGRARRAAALLRRGRPGERAAPFCCARRGLPGSTFPPRSPRRCRAPGDGASRAPGVR